ncbi:RagB/SusD family nutrient uptake outer membrane protein [Pedobacter sp. AW31-3R]|uniref:RagB/SusD family nutrient uptake outer membrane protein n=1 Tax=Pedobacter sp. AW31-3R TaxID=3445781 RepID=UPI003FA15E55
MKKIFILFICALAIASCKKGASLDNQANTGDTEETIFTDSAKTVGFLNNIYSAVGYSFEKGRFSSHGNTEQATDDAEYSYSGTGQFAVIMYNGTISPNNFFSQGAVPDFWSTPYSNVRKVNQLIAKIGGAPLSAALKTRMLGEARYLRAWYYHFLLVNFGGVPLIGDQVFGINDIINIPRSSFEESVNYVVSELDAVAAILPAPSGYAEENYGRATRGACLALKARVLLYAASPLFNGQSVATGELAKVVSYPAYDVSHWQKAADAAEAVINSGYYSLMEDNTTAAGYGFYNTFLKRFPNTESIFMANRGTNRDLEWYYNPPSRGGAKNSQPTEQLARAFPMKNGKSTYDASSGFDPANPYVNRDPRFYYSIIHNGALYYSTSTGNLAPVNTYLNAPTDGYLLVGTGPTTTGYYGRKLCDVNISSNSSFVTERGLPLMRYAEMLLNYAEAINEAGQTSLAYPKLAAIRRRAGIDEGADGLYGMKAGMTTEEMRTFIQNERRVELMNEDHRWNDIRRWKIAEAVNNGYNKAMKITKTGDIFTYEVVNTIRMHVFRPKQYLMPIPQVEILKMTAMVQNPGY